MPLGERSPHEQGSETGAPLLKTLLQLLACLTWKWLQIGTDMLLIITSTGNELLKKMLTSMTLNPQNRGF